MGDIVQRCRDLCEAGVSVRSVHVAQARFEAPDGRKEETMRLTLHRETS